MKLKKLLSEFVNDKKQLFLPDINIKQLSYEVEDCSEDTLLFYYLSHRYHRENINYISEIECAIEQGVKVILLDTSDVVYDDDKIKEKFSNRVYFISIVDLCLRAGQIASKFYNHPSEKLKIIGITGTNGKTSISHILAQSLSRANLKSAVIGSIGYGVYGNKLKKKEWTDYRKGYTTPHPIDLYKILAEFVENSVDVVSMEITSHSLAWNSLEGLCIDTAIFTNLSADHLEYHGSLYLYSEAKKKLFNTNLFPNIKKYIINQDDRLGKSLIKKLAAYNTGSYKVYTYSMNGDILSFANASGISLSAEFTKFVIKCSINEYFIKTKLIGLYYVENILAVFCYLKSINITKNKILECLNNLDRISGRMETFYKSNFPTCIVDFAHNIDGINKTFLTLKSFCTKKIICIFGCPGDRNIQARSNIVSIVEKYADISIVTSSNSYSENISNILSDIKEAFNNENNLFVIEDRKNAILHAFKIASKDDIILIIGKGSQDFIVSDTKKISHNDITFVQQLYYNEHSSKEE